MHFFKTVSRNNLKWSKRNYYMCTLRGTPVRVISHLGFINCSLKFLHFPEVVETK